jgi:hypothetical protein
VTSVISLRRLGAVAALGASSGCRPALGGRLDANFAKPSNYYVDVFTSAPKSGWTGGAIRGQLRVAE